MELAERIRELQEGKTEPFYTVTVASEIINSIIILVRKYR